MKIRIHRFKDKLFETIACYGIDNNTTTDRVCAFLLAMSPILQHYKGLYRNAGFTILLLIAPHVFLKLITRIRKHDYSVDCLKAIIPLLLFQTYKMFDHTFGVSKVVYGLFMLFLFAAIALGCINIRYFVKYATAVSIAAGVILVVQYICFYIFRFHLKMVPISLLLPGSSAWILSAQTGLYGLRGIRNSFYRPSAFFLEPSHLFLYAFPVLCLLLLSREMNNWRKRTAMLVSLGMVLSTSGMGVVIAIGLWFVYYMLYSGGPDNNNRARLRNLLSVRNILIFITFIALVIIAYFQIPVFGNMIRRIFSTGESGGSTAIEGRTRLARQLVSNIRGRSFFVGVTEDVDEINFNLSGFYATFYKYGAIGIFLSYWFYVLGLFRLRGAGFWLSAIIVVISFFTAHTHGTFYMIYYVMILANAYYMKDINAAWTLKADRISG